jgi:hypothetical protein
MIRIGSWQQQIDWERGSPSRLGGFWCSIFALKDIWVRLVPPSGVVCQHSCAPRLPTGRWAYLPATSKCLLLDRKKDTSQFRLKIKLPCNCAFREKRNVTYSSLEFSSYDTRAPHPLSLPDIDACNGVWKVELHHSGVRPNNLPSDELVRTPFILRPALVDALHRLAATPA